MNKKYKFYLVLVISLVLLGATVNFVYARLAVSPLTLKMEIPPGESSSANLSIHNTGQEEVSVNIQLVDWWRTRQGNLQLLAPGTRERSCTDWTLYSTEGLTMAPGEKKQVSVEVEVPEGEAGDHWAMLLVTEQPKETDEDQPVTTRITVNYAIKILQQDPTAKEKGAKITGIKVTQKDPLRFEVEYKNTGITHLQTTGRLEIRNLQGETIREYEISKFPTLPGEEHVFTVTNSEVNDQLNPGSYYAIVVMDFGGDHLIQGGMPIEISDRNGGSEEG